MITEKKIIDHVLPRMKYFHSIIRYSINTLAPVNVHIINFDDGKDVYFKDYIQLRFGPNVAESPVYDNVCRKLINHQFEIDLKSTYPL